MDKKELIKKIREIEISSIAFSNHVLSGEYHSFFKGNGMEFAGIRPYTEGDDIKKIDWKISSKQRKTYVKEYAEERELCFYLMVDISKSNLLGKNREFLTELVGILSFSAIKNGDKVGLILFTDKIEKYIIAKKGRTHALTILETVYSYQGEHKETKLKNIFNEAGKHLKKKSIVIMLSDFLDNNYEKEMKVFSMKHDFIPICIRHSEFLELPKGFIYRFLDSESQEEFIFQGKENYEFNQKNINGKSTLYINQEEDYLKKLSIYFKKRRS